VKGRCIVQTPTQYLEQEKGKTMSSISDLSLSNVTKVSAGYGHAVAISDGKLYTWGLNDEYQLGNGNTTNVTSPTQIGTDTDWEDVACGNKHSICKKTDGTIYAFGRNMESQCGVTGSNFVTTPTACSGVTGTVNKIAASTHYSMYLNTNSDVYGVGDNAKRTIKSSTDTVTTWTSISDYTGADIIAAGPQLSACYQQGVGVKIRGYYSNSFQYFSNTSTTNQYSLAVQTAAGIVPETSSLNLVNLTIGNDFILGVEQAGDLYGFTFAVNVSTSTISSFNSSLYASSVGFYGVKMTSSSTHYWPKCNYFELIDDTKNWLKLDAGFDHAAIVTQGGEIYSFGNNDYYQLGRTYTGDDYNLVEMSGTGSTGNWTVVGCGHYQTLLCKE
jgi:alpha-tubulin suppressor-like RCC1 family protein